MNIGDLFLSLLADGSRLEADVTRQADAAAGKAGTKAGTTLGQRISKNAGRAMTALGAAGGAIFVGAIESGAAFEDQLRTINTVAGLTDEELGAVGDSIQELSRETGKSTDDLAAGFYDLVSAGVPAEEAISVLRDSAKLAVGALGTTAETVDLVTSAMNAYGLKTSDSTRITDIFAKAVMDGKVTASELGNSIATIAPIAANAGVSLEEVSSGFAVLTAKGVPASEAATQMRSAIVALLTPNAELNKVQEETGINFAELMRAKGLSVALETLRRSVGGNQEAFAGALGRVEAYNFGLAATGENAEAFAEQIVETSEAAGIAADQYAEKSKSSVEQGRRFAAVLNTLAQDFGGAFAGAAPFLVTLNNLAPAMRGLLSPARLLGGAIGGVLGKSLSLVGKIPVPRGIANRILGRLGKSIAAAGASAAIAGPVSDVVGESLADGVSGAAKNGRLRGAMGKLSSFMGSGLGKGLGIAFAAVAWIEVINTYNRIKAELDAQSAGINASVTEQIRTGTTASLEQSKRVLEEQLVELNKVWDAGLFTTETRRSLEANLAATTAELKRRTAGIPPAVAGSLKGGSDTVDAAAEGMVDGVETAIDQAAVDAGIAAGGIPKATAAGILAEQSVVGDALASLKHQAETELTPMQEIAYLTGVLTSKELADGLGDKRPGVRAEAERTRDAAEKRLALLVGQTGKTGKKAGEALADGMKSKNARVRSQSKRTSELVNRTLAKGKSGAAKAGASAGNSYIAALRARVKSVAIIATFRTSSQGGGSGTIGGRASGGPTKAMTPYWVNERTPRTELFVPSTSGRVLTHGQAVEALTDAIGGPSGDQVTHITVPMQGALPVRTARDISRELQRVASLGLVPPKRLSPQYPRRESR